MTEKIDLGKNPFGAFAGEETGAATPPASDALSDLMQGGEAPVPGGANSPNGANRRHEHQMMARESRHHPALIADEMMTKSDRRAANLRTGLLLAAVALGFFLFVIVKYKVFGQ